MVENLMTVQNGIWMIARSVNAPKEGCCVLLKIANLNPVPILQKVRLGIFFALSSPL